MKPSLHHLATALLFLINVTACREIIDAPADMGSGGDAGMDMEVDAGPCGHECSGNLVCIEGGDAGAMCGCEDDGNCPASGNSACDTASHQCVQCTEDADCMLATASRCDTTSHTCAACTESAQCERLAATRVCNVGEGCVECTNTNRAACDAHVCDARDHSCTDRIAGAVTRCQACVSDGDCDSNHTCVQIAYGDPEAPVGYYCLPLESSVASATCADPANRPYVATRTAHSIDGVDRTFCGLGFATCEALVDYRTQSCAPAGEAGGEACGADGVADGVCEQVGSTGLNLCTVRCGTAVDCPGTYACNMTTGTCDVSTSS